MKKCEVMSKRCDTVCDCQGGDADVTAITFTEPAATLSIAILNILIPNPSVDAIHSA